MDLQQLRSAIHEEEQTTGKKCLSKRRLYNHLLTAGRVKARTRHYSLGKKKKSKKMMSEPEKWFGYTKKIPKRYYATVQNEKERKRVIKNIIDSRKSYKKKKYVDRIPVKSVKKKESPHVERAKRLFHLKSMRDLSEIQKKTGCSKKSLKTIIAKGRGAFYSSGSRPGQTADSWAYARLASALSGGKASRVDCKHLREGGCNAKVMRLAAKQGCKKLKAGSKTVVPCNQVPKKCSKSNRKACKQIHSCTKNDREYDIPRLYSREQCSKMKKKGFTQRASCIY